MSHASPEPQGSEVPPFSPDREVRFAVVLYGGVSLAIYINGIVQEILRLVRSTAPEKPLPEGLGGPVHLAPGELRGSEKVYRKIGQLLGGEYSSTDDIPPAAPVKTRFVVDVLSGSSAGGINAVFLAKALANNQDLEELKRLWISEGDIAKLINDRASVQDVPDLRLQNPPQALLNGQRMFLKLLQALEGMSAEPGSPERSRYAEELDLAVTATDPQGLVLPLYLQDEVIRERAYRQVFRFTYSTPYSGGSPQVLNDLSARDNLMLAFAARATSSIPFAFEPIRLEDLPHFLPPSARQTYLEGQERWKRFFYDYLRPGVSYRDRSFSDGGILDNKPFEYATNEMKYHRSDVPVERKLIFVDPFPETFNQDETETKPDALANAFSTLSLLRYEPIREDLNRVRTLNRQIERLEHITRGLENEVIPYARQHPPVSLADENWGTSPSYRAYLRLRVAEVTDNAASLLARTVGFDENSDEAYALRKLVRAWRERHYRRFEDPEDGRPSQREFLLRFDYSFHLRRLLFVLQKADQLFSPGEETRQVVEKLLETDPYADPDFETAFRQNIHRLKQSLNNAYVDLRASGRQLRARHGQSPLASYAAALNLGEAHLQEILERSSQQAEQGVSRKLLDGEIGEALTALFEAVARELEKVFQRTEEKVEEVWAAHNDAASRCLQHYYRYFELYDAAIFPITFGTEIIGASQIGVLRVSSVDAKSLINEQISERRKLAGTALMAFGAFFERAWRINDLLWGRLDAAERLITILLSDHPDAQNLIAQAHAAILDEELSSNDRAELSQLVLEALSKLKSERPHANVALEVSGELETLPQNSRRKAVLRAFLRTREVLEFVREGYEVDRTLQPAPTLRILARTAQVTGRLLGGLERGSATGRLGGFLLFMGRLGTGVLEVATTGSWWNLLTRQWLILLYLVLLVMIAAGGLLRSPGVRDLGFLLLVITAAAHLGLWWLSRFLSGRLGRSFLGRTLQILFTVLIILVVVSAFFGFPLLLEWARGVWPFG